MKLLAIIAAIVFTIATALAVEATVDFLRARSTGSAVILDWRSGQEGDLKHFEIERAGDDQVFRFVASVVAEGNNHSYQYTDEEAFGKGDENDGVAASYFTYRLKMVHTDNTITYSSTAGVSHNVSTVKRTWGMIKEMFR